MIQSVQCVDKLNAKAFDIGLSESVDITPTLREQRSTQAATEKAPELGLG